MKKTLFVFAIFLASVGVLSAQEGFKLGFRFSPLYSFASVTDLNKIKLDTVDYNNMMGMTFGLMVNYGFTENIGLHTGVHVGTRGLGWVASIPYGASPRNINLKQRFTTVEIPAQLKLRSPEIGTGIHIMGLFGVNAELNVSNKRTFDDITSAVDTVSGLPIVIEDVVTKDSKYINFFSASFVPGAGVDWEFDWGTITLGVSYHMGLLNVLRKANNGQINAKMNYIALDLGYYF